MPPRTIKPLDARVVALAEAQGGVLRRADLLALGMGAEQLKHRVRTGRLRRLHPGVFALGHRAISRRAEYLAAVWWCGADAALAYDSAAAFKRWIFEDEEHPPPVHVATTANRFSRPGVVVHRTRHLDRRDVLRYGLLPVTDDARTLIDLADDRSYRNLRGIADQLPALPKRRLIATAARLPGRAGAPRTQRLIHSEDAHTRSELERRHVAYCAAHGVPTPDERNVRMHGFRVDAWYAAERLVVELDSRAHHARRAEMAADRRRDRTLRRHGIDMLRLVWGDLDLDDPLAARDTLARLAGA